MRSSRSRPIHEAATGTARKLFGLLAVATLLIMALMLSHAR